MDFPLRTRLLGAFIGVAVLTGALTILAGSFLINRMVIGEAERRVVLGLKTAHAMWERRLDEALKVCMVMAGVDGDIAEKLPSNQAIKQRSLDELRIKCCYDFLQILDNRGIIFAMACGDNKGARASSSPIIKRVLLSRKPVAGFSLIPIQALTTKDDRLAARSRIRVLPTPHARPGGPQEITTSVVLEAAAPIMNQCRQLIGVVRVRTVINQNYAFVDFFKENVFTVYLPFRQSESLADDSV